MVDNYTRMFKKPPKKFSSPLEKGDHPELDDSEELEIDEIKIYQSLIGSMQWAVSLGRIDVCTSVMTLSSFRAAPRRGHLDRAKRLVGYLYKMKHASIRYDTRRPDMSQFQDPEYQWDKSVYGEVEELTPAHCPEPLGKTVDTTTHVDANLWHDLLTGRAVTGALHSLNMTIIDWYSKKQNTCETSTYGSEFSAARTATEQIMDLRTTLRYMGVPVGQSYMLGDNESVVNSAMIPNSRLNKRHTALSYHRVREAISAGIMRFFHISGVDNPSDILSKHWGVAQVWPVLKPMLFYAWQGSTEDPPASQNGEPAASEPAASDDKESSDEK
jgi:hypothetical protein